MDERIEIENGHVVMYRPTGPEEYQLVADSGFARWPQRLEGQPIFYPVTNETYARQITEQWNIRDHTEWWIPAENMEDLNKAIIGKIELIGRYPAE